MLIILANKYPNLIPFKYYKITIYLTNDRPKKGIRRYVSSNIYSVIERVTFNASWHFGKQNIIKVDVWEVPETDPEVVKYKSKWL